MIFILSTYSISVYLSVTAFLAIKHWNYYDGWLCVSVYMEMHFISPLAYDNITITGINFLFHEKRMEKSHFIFSFMNDFTFTFLFNFLVLQVSSNIVAALYHFTDATVYRWVHAMN